MELRPGYKKTEIGLIPEDWGIVPLGIAFETQLGKMLDVVKNQGIPKPYVGNRAVQWGKIDVSELSTMRMSPTDLIKYRLTEGDLLVCEGGEVGRSAIWSGELAECYFQKALHRLRSKGRINSRFALALLQDFATRGIFANFVTQTSIAHLPKEKLVQIPLPEPSPREQKAIAEALQDVDASITALSRLIAKKRDLRQGAMQRLLAGQTRLPGFTAPWQEKRLGQCLLESPSYGINAPAVPFSDRLPRYIRITDISEDGRFDPRPLVSVAAASSRYLLEPGDLVFARTGASVGKSYLYEPADGELAYAGFLIRVRPNPKLLESKFLAGLTTTKLYWNWVKLMSMRSGQPGINGQEYAQFGFQCPEPDEQAAISQILADMDAEIAALDARIEKTRALKQAMMQALLTGRVRLPVRRDAASQTKEAAHA